jgi:hypothetical protein
VSRGVDHAGIFSIVDVQIISSGSTKKRFHPDVHQPTESRMPDPVIHPVVTNLSGNTGALSNVNSAISIINSSYSALTSTAQQSAALISAIVIDPASANRSHIDIATNTLHLNVTDVLASTTNYVAADIIHDGFHILESINNSSSTGIQAEQNATALELLNAPALWLTSNEVQFLTSYMNDPNQIQARIDEFVYTPDSTEFFMDSLFTFSIDPSFRDPMYDFIDGFNSFFTFSFDYNSGLSSYTGDFSSVYSYTFDYGSSAFGSSDPSYWDWQGLFGSSFDDGRGPLL